MSESTDTQELASLTTSLRRHLQRRERVGIRFLPKGDLPRETTTVSSDANLMAGTEGNLFSDSSAVYEAKTLEELRPAISDCRRCKLWSGRTQRVFRVGNRTPKLLLV